MPILNYFFIKDEFKIYGGINFYFVWCGYYVVWERYVVITHSHHFVLVFTQRWVRLREWISAIQQFSYDPHIWRVAQNFHKASFLHWNSPKTLQKINKVLIGSKKPSYTSFFHFRENSFFWRQSHFFVSLEVHPECACSLIRPWWFSLKRIMTLTNIFLNNFFFW